MDYSKIYSTLIERAKHRNLTGYKEVHHIVPRCIGGSDEPTNLVELTAEEHYLAHQLLTKIHPTNHSLVKAATMMVCNRPSNKLYAWLRKRHSESMSLSQNGDKNSQYGTKWIHNKTLRLNKKMTNDSMIPQGWENGRIVDFDAYFYKNEKKIAKARQRKKDVNEKKIRDFLKRKHKEIRDSDAYRKASTVRIYNDFIKSGMSLRQFANSKQMVAMTLSNWFNAFIPEYKNVTARIAANKQLS